MKVNLSPFVSHILTEFEKNNFEIYIVGGATRDLLLGRPVKDWDFTTNATPEQILKLFPNSFYDNQFGTVGVTDKEQKIYEITTFRTEAGYSDRRHPDKITWGKNLGEDLARRDFTINAIALRSEATKGKFSSIDIQGGFGFELFDPFDGQKDLKAKIIRAVGDPEQRFSEDALRMIRAIRIATEIGFSIEERTFQAIRDNATLIKKIAFERIRDEIF